MSHQRTDKPTPEQAFLRRLKSLLLRIHAATDAALGEFAELEETKASRWACGNCGGEKRHFTKPMRRVACGACEKCGSEKWIAC